MGPFKTPHPFGVCSNRFASIGYHPGLDPSGTLRKTGGVGPGHYKIKDLDCPFKRKRPKDTWARKLELEEYSRTLGYKNAAIALKRRYEASKGGPGWYDFPDTLHKPCCHNISTNFSFGTARRFRYKIHDAPPPGTYGDPYEKIKQKPPRQFTNIPSFEWDGLADRFERRERSWELPCNRYTIDDFGGIDATLKKVVSKRGPYDIFTGPRDGTTVKGYFAPSSFRGAKTWPRSLPGCLDRLLKHKSKAKTGVFYKAKRIKSPRETDLLGPGYYDIKRTGAVKPNLFPFNSSVLNVRPTVKWAIHPGPGRYKLAAKCEKKPPAVTSQTWQFKSKTGRTKYHAPEYNAY